MQKESIWNKVIVAAEDLDTKNVVVNYKAVRDGKVYDIQATYDPNGKLLKETKTEIK